MPKPASKKYPMITNVFKEKGFFIRLKSAYEELKIIYEYYRYGKTVEVLPYEVPKGLHVDRYDNEKAVFYIKAMRARWKFLPWTFLFFGWFPVNFIISAVLGTILGILGGMGGGMIGVFLGTVISFIVYIWIVLQLFDIFTADLRITILPDKVLISEKSYSRQHFSGFTLGAEDETTAVEVGGAGLDAFAGDGSFGGVRFYLSYGRWGEFIDFKVARMYAHQYVIVLNAALEFVGAPAPKVHDPKAGRASSGL